MAIRCYRHPDGLGSIVYDPDQSLLVVRNEVQGTETTVLIGHVGLLTLGAALTKIGMKGLSDAE